MIRIGQPRSSGAAFALSPTIRRRSLRPVKALFTSLLLLGRRGAVVHALAASFFSLHTASVSAAPFEAGDIAATNIVAPFRITIANPRGNGARLQQELQRVQPFYRFYAGTAGEADKAFRESFAAARAAFLDAVERDYGQRFVLSSQLDNPRFGQLVARVSARFGGLPVSTNLARVWALGDSGKRYEDALAVQLRESMTRVIRSDSLPEQARPNGPEIRLIPASTRYVARDLAAALEDARPFVWTNVVTLSRARLDLEKSSVAGDEAIGRFLSGFVRDNCQFDAGLTRQAREKVSAELWTAEQFEPGQIIVRAGQRIDERLKRALDEISARAEADRRLADSVEARRRSEADAFRLQEELARTTALADQERRTIRWLIAAGAGAFIVVAAGLIRRARRRPARSMGLQRNVLRPGSPMISPGKRALPPGLMPHLARWLSLGIFQRLLAQRSSMIDYQRQAELEMARFEERLMRLHAPLHDRLRAYEQRIAELERQLESKAEENQELIRAVIVSTRRKLEAERSNSGQ